MNSVANSWSTSIIPSNGNAHGRNSILPKVEKKKGSRAAASGHNSHSAEVFGSKSLKSIMDNIEMVEI